MRSREASAHPSTKQLWSGTFTFPALAHSQEGPVTRTAMCLRVRVLTMRVDIEVTGNNEPQIVDITFHSSEKILRWIRVTRFWNPIVILFVCPSFGRSLTTP